MRTGLLNVWKDKRKDDSRRGWIAVGGVGLVSLALLLYFIDRSGQSKPLTQLETTLFSVLLAGGQSLFGYLLGRVLASDPNERFVRSAIRRVRNLAQGVGRIQDSVEQGVRRRLVDQPAAPADERELWVEICNLIYVQLEELAIQASASLEDWGEFGVEAQSFLDNLERDKRESIAELRTRIESINAKLNDGRSNPASGAGVDGGERAEVQELADLVEQYRRELRRLRGGTALPLSAGQARRHLVAGDSEGALEVYSRLIKVGPNDYSSYIGRAAAHYLAGNAKEAMKDLASAERLRPNEKDTIERIRTEMKSGTYSLQSRPPEALICMRGAIDAIRAGDVDLAEELAKKATENGLNNGYECALGASVAVMAERYGEAKESLQRFRPELAGQRMNLTILILRAAINALEGIDAEDLIDRIKSSRDEVGYILPASQVDALFAGLRRVGRWNSNLETLQSALTRADA
jgi:tetratricopeptide (TPR) repeat protein